MIQPKKIHEFYVQRINKVIDYVTENLDKSISLDEMASQAHFSSFHFHRIFTSVTGETVNQFTSRVRNEKAARLLRFSGKSVTEIAMECGFSSSAVFSRAFQKYFQVSPTGYKKGKAIKNSKIRKEHFSEEGYHCEMSVAELTRSFPVEIRELPERRIAYIRVVDAFKEGAVLEAFEKLIRWSREVNLFESQTFFGMSMDDPDVTPKEKYRYEACITLPAGWRVEPESYIQYMVLPKCKYAVTSVTGDMARAAAAIDFLIDVWLVGSSYECEHQYGLEVFLNKEAICDWSFFDLELFVPVQSLKTC